MAGPSLSLNIPLRIPQRGRTHWECQGRAGEEPLWLRTWCVHRTHYAPARSPSTDIHRERVAQEETESQADPSAGAKPSLLVLPRGKDFRLGDIPHLPLCPEMHMHPPTFMHICTPACTHTCSHMPIYIYVSTHTCTYSHTGTCIHAHTHICTHVCTQYPRILLCTLWSAIFLSPSETRPPRPPEAGRSAAALTTACGLS